MEVDTKFLKTLRGSLKIVEMLATFVAFLSFAVAAERPYMAAAGIEFCITLAFLLLYLLKFNKRFTYLCWPLMDVANSLVAAVFIFILSLVAVVTYSTKGTLIGGIFLTMSACLWSVDGILLFRKIFNKATNTVN
ncbi:chemokine-like factor [Brienomyrus brachyistius]|uniref:chemokine-like factor n=1 Tax=Brienomyrus brachyistius TaxID=42636 RepID=UPI0020B25841|nr:chemokine-like factor [Brienomyrus brachyistius]